MRQRIYIAGPISLGSLEANIKQATEAAHALMKAGYAPLCPHLTCYMGGSTPEVLPCGTVVEDWYQTDLPWVAMSDAVLRLRGESRGADSECDLARRLYIPIYTSVDDVVAKPPKSRYPVISGDPRYHEILWEMSLLHDRKAADYGTGEDPLANIRASEEFGIPAWLGAVLRGNDKMTRIKSFTINKRLENESLEDSLKDLAAYALISLLLWRESQAHQTVGGHLGLHRE
jgi:hypothetical protein